MIVTDILPIVRRELTLELMYKYGFAKKQIAEMFNVSVTAISQYVNGMRGTDTLLEDSIYYKEFMTEIERSAERIMAKESTVPRELCRICEFLKRPGMLDNIYGVPERETIFLCSECPGKRI